MQSASCNSKVDTSQKGICKPQVEASICCLPKPIDSSIMVLPSYMSPKFAQLPLEIECN